MEKKLLPYLVIISALSVSLSAAFYSVTGLSKMFSGASIEVMIMMGSLEIAKLVLASLLYQYWSKLNNALKTYYFIALFVLMTITSAGIYGYLSSAYSETSIKIENIDKNVKVLDAKIEMFETQLSDVRLEKQDVNTNISNLTNALSNNVIQTTDKSGQIITTTSSANRKSYENQLKITQNRLQEIQIKEISLIDSISTNTLKKLEFETNTEIAGEIGPLKYISKLTGKSIDQVVNWFIIALMLVFDPLAVSLVVGANVIFRDKRLEKEKLQKSIEISDKIKEFEQRESQFVNSLKEFEQRHKDITNKEDDFLEREKEIEDKEKEYLKKIEDLDEEMSKIIKEKKDLEEKELKTKEKYQNQFETLKKEKDELLKIKKEIEEDKKDVYAKFEKISEMESDIKNREIRLEEVKEDLNKLDSEIKNWESMNWKMRRLKGDKPPSAL